MCADGSTGILLLSILESCCRPSRPAAAPPPCRHRTAAGSYRYMAPEVFRHEPYNSRVDVYSFSMIVYQLFEVCKERGSGSAGTVECIGGRDASLMYTGRPH